MKNGSILLIVLLALGSALQAQSFRGLDKSPLDVAYIPYYFAHDREDGQKAIAKIYYSRPQVKGREIIGKKVKYGKVWRLGANEAAEMVLMQDVSFAGKKLKAGRYSVFAIPNQKSWTIIFSKDLDIWGAYSYNEKNDALRVEAPVSEAKETIEAFSIQFESTGKNAGKLHFAWEKTIASLEVNY